MVYSELDCLAYSFSPDFIGNLAEDYIDAFSAGAARRRPSGEGWEARTPGGSLTTRPAPSSAIRPQLAESGMAACGCATTISRHSFLAFAEWQCRAT